VLDDGSEVRAPLAGLVAGLQAAANDLVVVLPVDCPLVDATALRALADACLDAAVSSTGPLPGAYRRGALATLERCLARGELRIRDALSELDVAVVDLDPGVLANVNEPGDLERLVGTS
jgi:molybdopterin-guanine dinucleotide biosynthesis protein A